MQLDDFHQDNLHFSTMKDNIIIKGNFSKILYDDGDVTFNGIYLLFPIVSTGIYKDKEYRCHISFNFFANEVAIKSLIKIENDIINFYKSFYNINKINIYSLKTQLYSGHLKIYMDSTPSQTMDENRTFGLKISGIWENQNYVGLTYKFLIL